MTDQEADPTRRQFFRRFAGEVVGLAFLVELDFLKGRDRLEGRRVTSVVQY